ncbi:MAG: SNF2-related protein [Gammaproteobacteria bacterium]|nr:SNF2-related protein [Gammaproteobacteria bacterium]
MEPNTFVIMKGNPERAGILLTGEKNIAGSRMVEVKFADGKASFVPYSALEAVSNTSDSMYDRFRRGRFTDSEWLRRTLTRLRVTGKLSDVVYSMEATETDFYAHQFKPVIKMMNSPTDALLIADEVGLGKTIEAGLVWTELRARLGSDRLLVVCPKTLCPKWQDELSKRFGVESQIANAEELITALKRTRDNGSGFALVCSMQGLRPPQGWEDDEKRWDDKRNSFRYNLAKLLDDEGDGEPLIDLLVVDEAHHMRNPKTLLNQFGRLVNSVASHRLFLSATPIHLHNRDLHSLLAMVDSETFEFESTLNDLIDTNAPIIAARDMILNSKKSITEILEQLDKAQNYDILSQNNSLAQIRQELRGDDLSLSKRSELASRMERANQLANYVTRTRRRDVEDFRVIREPKVPILKMTDDEYHFYTSITKVVSDYAEDQESNKNFLLSTPQRLLTSSLAAASIYWSELMDFEGREPIEETDEDLHQIYLHDHPLVARIANCARMLDMNSCLKNADSKFDLLIDELRQLWNTEINIKVIIFSSFKPTLHYLQGRLSNEGIGTELLHGSIRKPRTAVLDNFKNNDNILILLSSEVGSEGVDLQFSSVIVNYDLPWNPMRLEQRIGRIDRLGQLKEKVMILNLIYDNTIDMRIYERLYKRLKIGERALGELEAVLGEPISEMTNKLLNPKLTNQDREKAIDMAAQALENRKLEEQKLEAEAGSLVQHGDYILERIKESRDRHRWLSGNDIFIYIRDRLQQDFPGCVIQASPAGSDTYRIDLSQDATMELQNFLTKRNYKKQTNLLSGNLRQRYRFTSSVVQHNDAVECISQLHPLVRFAADCDLRDESTSQEQAVATRVSSSALNLECKPGLYVLAARRWSSGSMVAGSIAKVQIGYTGAEVTTGKLIEADQAEKMMVGAAEQGLSFLNPGMDHRLAVASNILTTVIEAELNQQFETFIADAKADIEDRFSIRYRSLSRHFEKKIASLREQKRKLEDKTDLARRNGDLNRATKLNNLIKANEARVAKMLRTNQLRENEIKSQRKITPEFSDIGCVFLQLEA